MSRDARWVALVAIWLAGAVASSLPTHAQERRFKPGLGAETPERRIALVVGNRAYPQGPLITPENDAQDMASALRKLGFQVVLATNLDPTRFRSTIRRFEDLLAAADGRVVALVFYAGHGVQINGKNYLLPTDVSYKDHRDVVDFGIDADQLLSRIHAQEPEVTIMVFDACRDSPLPSIARSTRSAGGLARMDPPAGTFVAFATSPGSTASDNQRERNGLFTKYILQHIQTPGLNTEQVFRKVRTDVYRASRGQQLPEDSNRLVGGDFLFASLPSLSTQHASSALPGDVAQDSRVPAREPIKLIPEPSVARPTTEQPKALPPVQPKAAQAAGPPAKAAPAAQAKNAPPPKASPPPIQEIPQNLASAQQTTRAQQAAAEPVQESLLARLVNRRTGSLVYSATNDVGAKQDIVARIGGFPGALLVFNDGAIWTNDRALSEQSGLVFEPPLPMVLKDMGVGARWSYSGKFREKVGTARGQVDSSFEVVALESVASPFGVAKCFRVNEVRWVAGTRYTITRWIEVESLIPFKERTATVLSGGHTAVYVAPTPKALVELRAIQE